MIVEWMGDIMEALVWWLCGLIPVVAVPSWMTGAGSTFATVIGYAASLGAWVPLSVGSTVIAAVLACWVVGFTVKVVRIALSYLTLGGGSAG